MKRKLSLLLLLSICATMAWSQNRKVAGRVLSDSTRQPVSGVSVLVKGSTAATATDNDGQFSINIPQNGNTTLVFSSVGFTDREIQVGKQNIVNVTLSSSSGAMNEIV